MIEPEDKFMAAALACAAAGRGSVEPNPMVGAVIVRDGREIARGWHRRFGGPHAEVEALSAARAAGVDVRGATVYVTLEPCCHYGKTPPCTKALIEAGVARVVAAMQDPDARVAGKGLAALREAGIEVRVGVMEEQARELLAAYIKLRLHGRPWVIAKWAQTSDGALALPPVQGRWISSPQAREEVHRIRAGCDGVVVGIGTVLADDPLLNNRSGSGRQPVRVVLDAALRTPADSQLIRTARQWPTLIACTPVADPSRRAALQSAGAEIIELPGDGGGVSIAPLLDELGRRQWTHLLVEGGARVLGSFVDGGWADELLVFTAPRAVGEADLPRFDMARVQAHGQYRRVEERLVGGDSMERFRRA